MISLSVKSIMAKSVVSFKKGDNLDDITSTMAKRQISCVIIVENKKPIGLITERDILKLCAIKKNLSKLKARDVMSKKVISVQEDETIFKAATLMEKNKIRRLPVVNGGVMVGLITETDVVKSMTSVAKYLNEKLIEYITNT